MIITTPLLAYREEAEAARLAIAAGEHLLLVGPPGTGKSLFARHVFSALEGQRGEIALSRWSDETQLAGPLDVAALRRGVYRHVGGPVLSSTWLYVDEIYDASDVLLRTLLGVLHERVWMRGAERVCVPLRTCIASSNSARLTEQTEAVHDRFLLRWRTAPPPARERVALWDGIPFERVSDDETRITIASIDAIQARAARVTLPDEVRDVAIDFAAPRSWSPRRERKAARLLRVSAALANRDRVTADDLSALRYVAADGLIDQAPIVEELRERAQRLAHEREQRAAIEAAAVPDGDGIEAARLALARVRELAKMTILDSLAAARDERVAALTRRHHDILSALGVA